MEIEFRTFLKELFPPLIIKQIRRINKYGWFGNYSSWREAEKQSSGYEAAEILEKVKASLLKVKNGEAAYERDSVIFDKIEYSWPLLAGLMWVAAQNDGKLNILDFGGSLGSTYFQNKKFLKDLKEVKWNIVEQDIFVEYGKEYFENDELKFYNDIESCIKEKNPKIILFSCVLQYIERPYDVLQSVLDCSPTYIIVDNMPFLEEGDERITIQKIPPEIYKASYPCWFLNKAKFIEKFSAKCELVSEFQSHLFIYLDSKRIPYRGFIFKKL